MQIIDLLKKLGYNTIEPTFYNYINLWDSWYKGKVKDFHEYTTYNGIEYCTQEKKSLGMAKTVCEDWANYIFNRSVKITAEDTTADVVLQELIKKQKFDINMNISIETAFARGTTAITILENKDGLIEYDYIRDATMIFPLEWDNGEIISCCFASKKFMDGKRYYYLNIHEKEGEAYRIYNRFFEIQDYNQLGPEVYFESIQTDYLSAVKRFYVYSPAICNNISNDNPLGLSIFANAIDNLKAVDNAFDSLDNEITLGKKRIMVDVDALSTKTVDGKQVPVFSNKDMVFYGMNRGMNGEALIKEIDMKLRVDEHKKAIQEQLNYLSMKVGMGVRHYNFESSLSTATEIRASSDTLYNSMLKHETPLEGLLKGLFGATLQLMGYANTQVNVEFDDSVIKDTEKDLANRLLLLDRDILKREEVRSWWTGETIEEAVSNLPVPQPEVGIFGA